MSELNYSTCPTCDSKLATDEFLDYTIDLDRREIIKNGGTCPACNSELYSRNSKGKQIIQNKESRLHYDLCLMTAGLFCDRGQPHLEKKIGNKFSYFICDVVIEVEGYAEWNGIAIEVIVDADQLIEEKRAVYEDNGYTLVCVYPEDYKGGLDKNQILDRELEHY